MSRVSRAVLRSFAVLVLSLAGLARPLEAGPLEEAPSRFAALDGARVHYKSLGSGEDAVVLVHGWTCDLTFWTGQAAALASRGRVLALDLPGHGRSDAPARDYTMDLFARAVEAVLADGGVARATLVGHSMGTAVVRQVVRRSPGKVVALVAVDGALRPFLTDPGRRRDFLARFDGERGLESRREMVESMWSPSTTEAVKERVRAAMLGTSPRTAASAMKGMLDDAVWTEDPIRVPLLLLLAPSPHWDADYEAYVRKLAPAAEFVRVPGTGHFLMLEKPDEVNTALLSFLARCQKG
jgi:pimeloyl-ACP methyl ester carboxylesterase